MVTLSVVFPPGGVVMELSYLGRIVSLYSGFPVLVLDHIGMYVYVVRLCPDLLCMRGSSLPCIYRSTVHLGLMLYL